VNLVRLVVRLPCFVVLVMPPLAGGAADPQNTMKVCNERRMPED